MSPPTAPHAKASHGAAAARPRWAAARGSRRFSGDRADVHAFGFALPGLHPIEPFIGQQFLDLPVERIHLGAQVLTFLLVEIELHLLGRLLQGELGKSSRSPWKGFVCRSRSP